MYEWYNGNWQRESSLGSRGGENNSENIEIFRNKMTIDQPKTNDNDLGSRGGENNSQNIEIFRNKEAQKLPLTNQKKMTKTNTKLLGEKGGENNI